MQNYAHWDSGPYQDPPRPPERPSFWAWQVMTEREREAYDAGVAAYLMALGDGRWYAFLCDAAIWYRTWYHERHRNDPNWKRGGE